MGLMDVVGGALGGKGAEGGSQAGLVQVVMGLIQNYPGGVQGLLAKFQGAGLGEQVASWTSGGPARPVTGDQVQKALGPEPIQQVAQQAGIPAEQASQGIASLLPQLVSQLAPTAGGIGGLVGKLIG